jgi:hypothetical protein
VEVVAVATTSIRGLSKDAEALQQLRDGIANAFAVFEAHSDLPEGAATWYETAVDAVAERLAPRIADQLEAAVEDELAERRARLR